MYKQINKHNSGKEAGLNNESINTRDQNKKLHITEQLVEYGVLNWYLHFLCLYSVQAFKTTLSLKCFAGGMYLRVGRVKKLTTIWIEIIVLPSIVNEKGPFRATQ